VPLQADLVEVICGADSELEVLFEPELLPPPRYPNDHRGEQGFARDSDGEARWRAMLARAEVLFGIPGDSPQGLADAVHGLPRLRWVQATAAGAGEQVRAASLTPEELERVIVTSSSGVHAGPLAEFCLLGLLAFAKDLPRLCADKQARRWGHYPMSELGDRTLLVIGLGKVGAEVARLAAAMRMRVVGVNRSGESACPHVDAVYATSELGRLVPDADALVITLPLTRATRGLIDADMIAAIKPGATLVNVGRGGVVDEPALITALRERRLSGAALDVFATEPLPADSPLWELPNVLLSPHTAALSLRENERIVELFCENVRRYRSGAPLLSRVDPDQLY
jgi:phosphoglycerate dehydrogenase-like enzyme